MSGGLVLILGDQLDQASAALAGLAPAVDRVLMIESREESQRIWSHQARTAVFLSAMRHHAEWLRGQGHGVEYIDLDHPAAASFDSALRHAFRTLRPDWLRLVEPGEFGVRAVIDSAAARAGVPVEWLADSHFLCSVDAFRRWRHRRSTLVMEHFYRQLRQREGILLDANGGPVGGRWNLDADNRKAFGRQGPGMLPAPRRFAPDALTREVFAAVERHFPDHPGSLAQFAWPVTRAQAQAALADFIEQRLAAFGPFQDAMWAGEPFLNHSLLAVAINLKLLHPREVIDAVLQAHAEGRAPLSSVEGFVRQVLGWREYVRGVYWTEGPDYLKANALGADRDLPGCYWTGDTDMACLRAVIGQTLQHGYAHHIQRLMVTGLYAMLLGVEPAQVHRWYLAVYVDAIEWVEAPNTLGMSQYADGGLLGSKPYVASGQYIARMSNYCDGCRYRPELAIGERACPFSTLYWDFLARHRERFLRHPRAALQWRGLQRLDPARLDAIRARARWLRDTAVN